MYVCSSPPPPLKRKLSINLMESVDSEASIDSPDREYVNLNLSNGRAENETRIGGLEFKTKKGIFKDVPKKQAIGKMSSVGETEIEIVEKKNADLSDMKNRLEFDLKQARINLEENFKIKLDALKETLKNELASNEANINKVSILWSCINKYKYLPTMY